MITRSKKRPPAPSSEDVRVLSEFVRGYLHEDFEHEHGHAIGAAAAFAADATNEERMSVADALDRVASYLAERPQKDLSRVFVKQLRSVWVPASVDDIRAIAAAIRM